MLDAGMFGDFSSDDIEILATYGVARRYPKNSILIHKGDESLGMYIILEGRVKVFVSDEQGNEVILRYQDAGEFFGELALLDDHPRSASVASVEDTKLSYISNVEFEHYLAEHPEVCRKLVSHLIGRVRSLTDDLADCALKNVYQRLRDRLKKMAVEIDGEFMIDQPLTHQDIAGLVGCGREMVSRIMKKLQNKGYIDVRRKRVYLLKKLPRNLPA